MENSLTYIVIDNNPAAQECIVTHLQDMSWLSCEGTFFLLADALCYMKKHPVDIAFLELDLPDIDGLDILLLKKKNCKLLS